MTRTAQKKAAQAARLEKKRAKAASRGTPSEDAPPPVSPPVDSPTTEEDATLGPAESTYLVVPPPADAAPADAAPAPAPPPPATNGHVKHNTAAHPEIPAYPLSTKAATEPEAVLPEPPLQRAAAPVVAAVKQTAETVSSAATAVAEPVQAALSKASESAKDALAKTPVNSVVAPPEDPEKAKKRQNALTRTLWTFIMIGGFLGGCVLSYA
jgi:phosphatidate cytidylyltransferase